MSRLVIAACASLFSAHLGASHDAEMEDEPANEKLPDCDSNLVDETLRIQQFSYDPASSAFTVPPAMLRRSQREMSPNRSENEAQNDKTERTPVLVQQSIQKAFIPMKRPSSSEQTSRLPSAKLARLSKSKSSTNIENKLKDSLRPGLKLIMVGVNPGETTARTGEAYAHKSNRYWPTMFASGVTPIQHLPKDTHSLMDLYGIGHTNIVARPTKTEAEIQDHEWPEGAAILDEKIAQYKPEGVAIVGKGIWKKWVEYKTGRKFNEKKDNFSYGWQPKHMQLGRQIAADGTVVWPGAKTIVVATTSGLAAQFAADKGAMRIKLWKPLGDWYKPLREEWERSREEKDTEQEKP